MRSSVRFVAVKTANIIDGGMLREGARTQHGGNHPSFLFLRIISATRLRKTCARRMKRDVSVLFFLV
jgi:hypothetical protein